MQTNHNPRRSLRKRAERPSAPHPEVRYIRVYERGSSFSRREHPEVDDLLDRFHSDRRVQARCRDIRQVAAEHLVEYVVDYGDGRQGRGYRAIRHIKKGTAVAFYTGRLEKVGLASCCHLISIGPTELGYSLTVDGTPLPGQPPPVGSMQMVNHSCTPNCVTTYDETDSTLEFVVLISARDIAVDEPITFAYGGSFWRPARELIGQVTPGHHLVHCACASPCPNGFARIERARVGACTIGPARPAGIPPARNGPARSPLVGLTGQEHPRPSRSDPPTSTSPMLPATPEPDPPPEQALPPQPGLGPVRFPSPAPALVLPDEEAVLRRALTRSTIVTLNVGPVGLASSLPALAPILEKRPVAVLLQEAHIQAAQLQSMRALVHRHYPAYTLFANRKARTGSKIDVVTLVHIRMAARASLLDISKEVAPLVEHAPDALRRVHFVRILDPEGQVAVLLGNVHQAQARETTQQTAVLAVITRVIARWGPDSHHVVIGGDWNGSLAPRVGYAVDSITRRADMQLEQMIRESGLHYVGPKDGAHTWSGGRRKAVLDAFVVRNVGSIDIPDTLEPLDPHHDHRPVLAALLDDRIGPMPELEALQMPVRLKLESLKDPEKKRAYLERATAAVGKVETREDTENPFDRLARLKAVVLEVAKNTLGIRGGRMKPLLPRHTPAFQRLAARIRLLRVVRKELWDRGGSVLPASKAIQALWHRDPEAFPDGTTYQTIDRLASEAGWIRRAVAGLRARIHSADEELRRLRSSERTAATEKQRQAAIDSFWTGGGLRRFLHPPSPSLHSPILRGQVPSSITIQGAGRALTRATAGSAKTQDGPGRLTAAVTSRQQLAETLEAAEIDGARVLSVAHKPSFITDRRERIATWVQWLGEAAGATKQRCSSCASQDLCMVPGLKGKGTWWCAACSRTTTPSVDRSEYEAVPLLTAGIAKIPAGATLRGPITREDFNWQVEKLRKGGAPGPDEVPYELLTTAPEALKTALLECVNKILVDGWSPPEDWLGGLVRLLPKPAGDPMDPGSYRPICLLNCTYKVLSAVINDRLYRLCEQHGLLDPSQEGFRRLRSTQRQVQSLHWSIEEAARKGAPLYVAYLDFENAFNSVDHEALFRWLEELQVPDVDLLRALYKSAYYEADLPYGRSAPVYLRRGTKQGDPISPLLFNLLFNALLIGLRQSGVGVNTITGLRPNGRGFADDLTLTTGSAAGMQRLLQVVSDFCTWSGMRIKMKKSVVSAYDFKTRKDLPTDDIRYNGEALVCLPAHESYRYLGVRTTLAGGKGAVGPGTRDEVHHVFGSTKELIRSLADHQIPLSFAVPSMRMVAASRFRYSAALVQWTDADLEELFKIWMQVERAAWKLQRSFPSAQFRLPSDSGGTPVDHPRVVLVQALAIHITQLVALPDELRELTIRSYRQLCRSCGCSNERELTRSLAKERKPRRCPVARLLRACGQLEVDIILPDCLTSKAAREVSWYALLEHIRTRVAQEGATARSGLRGQDVPEQPDSGPSPSPVQPTTSDPDPTDLPAQAVYPHHDNLRSGQPAGSDELACVEKHWATIRARLRGRGIHFPRQLLLDRTAAQAVWLLPDQMSGNPGWLKPLRRLLARVDVPTLFHSLDRGEGAPEPPAHQELVHLVLHALKDPTAAQRLPDIFADDRWLQVRSSAPAERWIRALRQERVEPPMETVDNKRQIAVEALRVLGANLQDRGKLRRLVVWLAPSLYTVGPPEASSDDTFTPVEPLSREYVSLTTDPDDLHSGVSTVGEFRLCTSDGVVRITRGPSGSHVGTVNMGRWRMLAEEHDNSALIRALPGWIAQVAAEERSRGVPSHQVWLGINRAFRADVIIGCCPLVAPACFRAALCGREGMGWGRHATKERQVINALCLPADILHAISERLRPNATWLVLTRAKSLTAAAEERLKLIGKRLHVWRKGAIVAAGTGVWRRAQVRSVQSKEEWTLWASAQTVETEGPQLRQALHTISLSRDGTVPLDSDCPSIREARLGPAGSHLTYSGVVVATDGAVKDDGRMGGAYVSLDNKLPTRSFVVLGPPSSMRAELSPMDEAVADAPGDQDLTLLTDSLTSIQRLMEMQRQDFPAWLHGHPERALLESLVRRINARARARVLTRIIKVPAHKAHALNEAADAAASRAATEADGESVALTHTNRDSVRFYVQGKITEWGAKVRKTLAQTATSQHRAHLTSLTTDEAGEDCPPRARRAVSLTDRWLLRQDQGRRYLGQALADMRPGAKRRRVMQTVAGVFPCRALLHRWGKAPSPQCPICHSAPETVGHIQCFCPGLKNARIAAHHTIAKRILQMLQTHSVGSWQFHHELAIGSLRAIDVPLDMHDPWQRMLDEMDEMDVDDDQTGDDDLPLVQNLERLRPDMVAISWSKRRVLLLELTRAQDWKLDWSTTTDAAKIQRYRRLQQRMQDLLPQGWVVETVPLTVGIRGSFHELDWRATLNRFGIGTDTQNSFFQDLTRQALEELDRMYGVRSEALRHTGPDAGSS